MEPYNLDSLQRVARDVNGNTRYVIHYLALLTEKEQEELPHSCRYGTAVAKAKKLFGGKRYRSKEYGGGIVFQSANPRTQLAMINAIHNTTE